MDNEAGGQRMGYNFLTKEAAVPQIGREIDVTVTTSMFVPRIKREDTGATIALFGTDPTSLEMTLAT